MINRNSDGRYYQPHNGSICLAGLFFIYLVTTSVLLSGQQLAKIKGVVLDKTTSSPIENVNIFFESSTVGTITDSAGNFSFSTLAPGNYRLIFSHIGYFKNQIYVNLISNSAKSLQIFLTPKTIFLQEIVSTASRRTETIFKSHQSVDLANEEKIAVRTSPNTADALREIPGVLVQKTTAGHGSPIIRGLIGKDVLLLYNGIRLNKPTFRFGANQYMNTINVEGLDQIEIVKGPGSVMYGSDAIGGLINMVSPEMSFDDNDQKFRTTVSLRYGSADNSRIFNAAVSKRTGRILLLAAFGAREIGNLQAGKKIGVQKPTGYDEWDTNFKIGYQINETTSFDLDFLTVFQNAVPRYDKYETGQYQTFVYDPQNRYLTAFTLRSNPSNCRWINSLQWNFSYQLEQEGTVEIKTDQSAVTKNQNDLTTLGSTLQIYSILSANHILTYGYELYWDKIKSSQTTEDNGAIERLRGNFPDGSSYTSLGLFLNDNYIINQNFDLTAGVRWSQIFLSSQLGEPFGNYDGKFSDLTGTIGLSYRPKFGFNFVINYAKGFRAPNFNDTVALKVSNSGVDAPNPGLAPEKCHNFEAGIKLNQEKFTGSLFLFYNRLIDIIDRYRGSYNGHGFFDENRNGVRDSDEVDIYQKRNATRTYIAGWELSGNIKLSSQLAFNGFLFWTYGQNITFNEPMSRIPPLMGMAAIVYQPKNFLQLEPFFRAAQNQDRLSARDIDDSRIPEGGTPGWFTINFRTTLKIENKISVSITLENITDETYKEHGSGVYSPGRNLVVGLKYHN